MQLIFWINISARVSKHKLLKILTIFTLWNPLSGALKFFSTTLFNSVHALVFFLIAGHLATPSYVGKIAIIQLMETIMGTFLSILPY